MGQNDTQSTGVASYDGVFRSAREAPTAYWRQASRDIDWIQPYDRVYAQQDVTDYQWFPGGILNTCHNALDRHVRDGRGEQVALIHDSPVTKSKSSFTYRDLLHRTERLAGALAARGVGKGDRVVIYMPMIPETVMAMLACTRLGAIHSVVFGGFAAPELAVRIDDLEPKAILLASCGIEPGRIVPYKPLLDEALTLARTRPDFSVVLQRENCIAELNATDIEWSEFLRDSSPHPCVPVQSDDPLYVLYTSGTTGRPKGVVRDNGGHAVALHWSMHYIYGCEPGDVFWAASDVGWVVGHSYIVYGPLLFGGTTVLYEGKPVGTPDAGAFWRVAAEHKVSVMFTAPTAIRAIRQQDPDGARIQEYDLNALRALFLAGERCDPDTLRWCEDHLDIPVIDHWWQTETGWPIVSNPLGIEQLPIKAGSPTKPVPGWDVKVVDERGTAVPPSSTGEIVIKLPLPPGACNTLWRDRDRFLEGYLYPYPGYYKTGDAGYLDEDGYLYVLSRTDDVINVAGHRLSTGVIEELITQHPDIVECAVVGVADPIKGQVPFGFIVPKDGCEQAAEAIEADAVARVREGLGPVAAFKRARVVSRLPKTRSGKILRKTIRAIANGESTPMPATIDDPATLDAIRLLFPKA